MAWIKPSQLTSLLGVLLSTTAVVTSADAQQSFAKVGAVNQQATGTPPGGSTRTLSVGSNIVVKERVRTSASGSTQIQFPDQSAINLGANCDMVIDEFVYDPQAKSGAMVASVSRGALRYIGGNISHNAGVTIRTPTGNLGIRGGSATAVVGGIPANIFALLPPSLQNALRNGGTLVLANFGQIQLNNNVDNVTLKVGFATVLGGPNDPIPAAVRIPDEVIKLLQALIMSKPGQTGGVANIPTEGNVPQGYKYTVIQDPTNPPGTDPLGYLSIFSSGNSAAKGAAQAGQAGAVAPPPPPSGECCN